ncbi:MAG: EamA family transporter, partial [Dokdonella sp.]|nr:EamA family transporter [Dokdonella sp.]
MLNLAAAVVCSVLVSVLLKLAPRWRIGIDQAVAWNYLVAGGASLVLLAPQASPELPARLPWPVLGALGVLLPTIFLVLARAVREAGIARSDVAQRLSLLLPLLAAFVLFGERLSALKLAAATLGLVALAALTWRGADAAAAPRGSARWLLLVFVGFGVIDILFKRLAAGGLAFGAVLPVVF